MNSKPITCYLPILLIPCLIFLAGSLRQAYSQETTPQFRPSFHFSPPQNWLNDPNGLVFFDGEYHLFYQYNPQGNQWGNMSWGHAVTTDFINWEHLPLAIPMSGNLMAFSGSVVIDWHNSSGFGDGSRPPMVAIYTATDGIQRQHLAYSHDKGRNWQNFAGNPVLNLYDDDFRDPKVIWHEPTQKWIMVVALANRHRIRFYASSNLRTWQFLQDFGPTGDVSGAWECPDFFPLRDENQSSETKWVLQLSVGPGKTRYFMGDFDGNQFVADKHPAETVEDLPGGELIDDFESESFDKWYASGPAFAVGPTSGGLPGQLPVSGYLGSRLANSFNNGDQAIGTLSSIPFKIEKKYLNFKLGGGNDPLHTYIKLLVNGETVYRETGSRDEFLVWKSWPVEQFIGQDVQIVLVDSSSAGWGHILADQMFQSDSSMVYRTPPVGRVVADFEGEDYENWTVLGTAFGSQPAQGTWPGQQMVTGYLGHGLVNSYIQGDEPMGKLISPPFVIDSNYVSLLVGGGNQPGSCFVKLLVAGNQVAAATGMNEERLRWVSWDLSAYYGQEAIIEIVDSASGGWGHINVDHLIMTNNPPVDMQAEIDIVDYGMDFYATQSYHDIPESDGRRIWLAWMSNWSYASQVPTHPWRGIMSVPREVGIKNTEAGYVLTQKPLSNLEALRDSVVHLRQLPAQNISRIIDTIGLNTFELNMTFSPQDASMMGISLRKGANQETKILYDVQAQKLIFDRSQSGKLTENESFSAIQEAPLPMKDGKVKLQILVDMCSVEIFANEGELVMTNLIFPDSTSNGLAFILDDNQGFIDHFDLWQLKPAAPNAVSEHFNDDLSVVLYPNPTGEEDVMLKFESLTGKDAAVDIYDASGKWMTSVAVSSADSKVIIPNKIFKTNGTYLLLIRRSGAVVLKKLQVAK